MLEELFRQNGNHSGCIIIAGYKISEIKEYSTSIQIPVLDGNLNPLNEPIVISDMEQAKGYEFDTVVIVNCEQGILPAEGVHHDEVYRSACQLYVSMTRAKNDLYISYHKNPSAWLENIKSLYKANWADVESISKVGLVTLPVRLNEIHDPVDIMDEFVGMTGENFIYTKAALGLSVDQQNKLVELVDGRGLWSSSKKEYVKWRDIRDLAKDLTISPQSRSVVGPLLYEKIYNL